MEITLNPQSDLTREKVESLLRLIDTPDKRRGVLSDLCTLRENLVGLFGYESSPFANDKTHPLWKIMLTSNEIIGSLLISGGDELINRHSKYGEIVEVVEERIRHINTCNCRCNNYSTPQQRNTRIASR